MLRSLQVRQHFLGVAVGFHVIEDVGDLAVGADDKSCARDAHHFLAVHVLFFDHPESIANFLVGVGKQGVGQLVLVLKFLLGL